MKTRTIHIEIDCAPGTPRPNSYLGPALRMIDYNYGDTLPKYNNSFFGNWTWDLTDEVPEDYSPNEHTNALREYFVDLDEKGLTRYSTWHINVNI